MDDFQGKMYEMDWDFLVVFCLALYFIVSVIFAALFYVTGVRFRHHLPLRQNVTHGCLSLQRHALLYFAEVHSALILLHAE